MADHGLTAKRVTSSRQNSNNYEGASLGSRSSGRLKKGKKSKQANAKLSSTHSLQVKINKQKVKNKSEDGSLNDTNKLEESGASICLDDVGVKGIEQNTIDHYDRVQNETPLSKRIRRTSRASFRSN